MHSILLHQHKRKIKSKKSENKFKTIDNLVTVVAVVYPLSTIPQIIGIWVNKNTEGISLITWSLFLVLQSILLVYGIAHKEKRLILMWSLWCLVYAIIVVGLVLYS
ncbi:hypothetical protein J4413_02780 [Candidatus Woesearchaeota archaeon]|nr:hypothetical protein [Candidatus Woesearchaeota archaeon]